MAKITRQDGVIVDGIMVGEHIFELPPMPAKKDILFSDLPREQQYWRRQTDIPDLFYEWTAELEEAEETVYRGKKLLSISTKDLGDADDYRLGNNPPNKQTGFKGSVAWFQGRELHRRKHGVWFMNDGEPTYITGHHYFGLQWCKLKDVDNLVEEGSPYGMYLQFQRDFFYFYEICKSSKVARGGFVVKPKKTGVTNLMAIICLNEGTLNKQKLIRMMSTSQKIANKTIFSYIDFALQGMPTILTPSIRTWNLGEVYFGMSEKKNSKAGTMTRATNEEFFDTHVTTVPTANNAFDSLTNYLAWIDEFTKIITEAQPKELHEITKDTVIQGFSRKGTIIYTGYTQEFNDDSFFEGREIFMESKLKTIDPATGMTKSMLICYTMLAQHGLFGQVKDGKMEGIDKHGRPILEDIWKKINDYLDQNKNDPLKIQGFKRRFPTSENDPWSDSSGEGTLFDNIRLSMQLQEIEEDESLGKYAYEDFNLEFNKHPELKKEPSLKGVQTQYDFTNIRVNYVPVTDEQKIAGAEHGRFNWFDKEWTPQLFLNEHLNKLTVDRKTGMLKPRLDCPFFASLDPTDYSLKSEVVMGSMNSLHVFVMPNGMLNGYFGKDVTNKRLMVEYLYRPQKPSDTLFDVIKCVLFFGCYILIENNKSWITTKMIEMGLGNFIMVINEDGGMEPYRDGAKQTLFSVQTGTVGKLVVAGKNHLGEPDRTHDMDNIKGLLKSKNVLKQLMKFKPEDTKVYDAAMSYLEGLWGIDNFLGYRAREEYKINKRGGGIVGQAIKNLLQ